MDTTVKYHLLQGTDVMITAGPDPVHRDSPFTRQSRGCGRPGHFVSLPVTFLARLNQTWATWGDPAKVFVNEWAKLRSVRIPDPVILSSL